MPVRLASLMRISCRNGSLGKGRAHLTYRADLTRTARQFELCDKTQGMQHLRWTQSFLWLLLASCAQQAPTVCNGSTENCQRRFDQVTFAATHNAFSYASGGPVEYLFPNQDRPISAQLAAGIRGLGIRPCPYYGDDPAERGRVYVTHNFDLRGKLGSEPLVDVLGEVRSFLEENPTEVVTLFAESAVTPAQIAATFAQAGLTPYLFTYDSARGWPTLAQLIEAGTRLVVFNDSQEANRPAWQHYLWDHIVDTDYNITSAEQFSCEYYRGRPSNSLYFINQFIYEARGEQIVLPSASNARLANDPTFVTERARRCWQQKSRIPNFIYVDWFGQGDVMSAVHALNEMPR